MLSAAVTAVTEILLSIFLYFRGNHYSHFTVPILDHRHSSHAGSQEDRASYNAPLRLSVMLTQTLCWSITSAVLHHFRQVLEMFYSFAGFYNVGLCVMPYIIFVLLNYFPLNLCLCLIYFHAFCTRRKQPVNPEQGKYFYPPRVSFTLSLPPSLLDFYLVPINRTWNWY